GRDRESEAGPSRIETRQNGAHGSGTRNKQPQHLRTRRKTYNHSRVNPPSPPAPGKKVPVQVVDLTQESDEEMVFGGQGVGLSPPPPAVTHGQGGGASAPPPGFAASRGPPPPLIRFRLPCRYQGSGGGGGGGGTAAGPEPPPPPPPEAPLYVPPCIHTHAPPPHNPWQMAAAPPPPPPPHHLLYTSPTVTDNTGMVVGGSVGYLPPRLYPVHHRLWQSQHRMQEMHRRRLDHHLQSLRHRELLLDSYHQGHGPPHLQFGHAPPPHHPHQPPLPPPQQPTVYSRPEVPHPPIHPPTVMMAATGEPVEAMVPPPPPPMQTEIVVQSTSPGEPPHQHVHHYVHHYHQPGRMHHLHISIGPTVSGGTSRPQELVFPPVLPPELMSFPLWTRHMTRLEDIMRVAEHRRLATANRGASQDTIERFTFPHKYKRMKRTTDDMEDNTEKCTICLSEFEDLEDVR
ncbi:hypothetical protein AAG570_005777, partial [Ranatra chinensis]